MIKDGEVKLIIDCLTSTIRDHCTTEDEYEDALDQAINAIGGASMFFNENDEEVVGEGSILDDEEDDLDLDDLFDDDYDDEYDFFGRRFDDDDDEDEVDIWIVVDETELPTSNGELQ